MHTTLSIPGIHCQSCAALITDVSGDFPAIQSVDVDLQSKTVTLNHKDTFDLAAWTKEIEALNSDYHVQQVS